MIFCLFKHLNTPAELSPSSGRAGSFIELTFLAGDEDAALSRGFIYLLTIEIIDNLFLILLIQGRRGDESCAGNNVEADEFFDKNSYYSVPFCYKIRSFSLFLVHH